MENTLKLYRGRDLAYAFSTEIGGKTKGRRTEERRKSKAVFQWDFYRASLMICLPLISALPKPFRVPPCRSATCWEAGPQLWFVGSSHSRTLETLNDQSGHFFKLMWGWFAQASFLNYNCVFGHLSAYDLLCLLGWKVRPCSSCCSVWELSQILGRTSVFMTITNAQWKSPVNEEKHP